MTISTTTLRITANGNGSTTTFPYTWKVFAQTELTVIVRTTASGAESVRAIGTGSTNYSVTGVGETSGGNVVFVTAPTSAETVTIIRNTALTQGTDYQPATNFPATSHEDALDKLTHIVQELDEELSRSVKVSRSTTISSSEITDDADTRASKLLGFDSDGDLESTTGRVSSVSVSNVATSSGAPGTATASFTTSSGALALGIPIGQTGMMGGISMQYSTTTADADPGAGFIRLNNASLNSATIMYVDDSDGTTDITAWVQSWDDADGANRGIITLAGNPNTASPIVTFKVTGAVTDASGYTKIPVVYLAGSTSISNNAEISLAFSPAGSSGVPPGLGLKYSTTTADADPGAGYIRFNNGTLSSASICYIDDADLAGADISGLVQSWDDSTNTALRGTITLVKETNTAVWAQWNITGAATNASGYTKQALTYVAGTGSFSNDDLVRLSFSRTGNLGATGSTGSTGSTGATGAKGDSAGILMAFETTTTDTDQGAGKVWLNHGTASSASVVYMDDVEAGGTSINSLVDTWDDSTTTSLRGTISIYKNAAPENFMIFNVTGAVSSASTYSKIAATFVQSAGTISDGDAVSVQFVRTGNAGGGMSSFIMSDGSTTQTVENGETQTFAAGEAIDVAVSATNTVTFSAEDASTTNKGVAELATTAETVTGTDTGRVVTPAGLHGALAGLTDTTITASDTVIFSDATDSNALKEDTVQGILDLASGGAWSVVATSEGSGVSGITLTGIDSTCDTWVVAISDLTVATDEDEVAMRFGTSSGIETGSTSYRYLHWGAHSNTTSGSASTVLYTSDSTAAYMQIAYRVGSASREGMGAILYIHVPADSTMRPNFSGTHSAVDADSYTRAGSCHGSLNTTSSFALDRINIYGLAGNISGRVTLYKVAHA